jgi:hypothetical protein
MGWVVRRLLAVYALFGTLAALARWRHAPAPWLDGLLAAAAGTTLIAMGWRARATPESVQVSDRTAPANEPPERALP